MKTCFHSHFYTSFHAYVTLLFLLGCSLNFHQNVELKIWEGYTPFWEVFAHFLIGKGQIFGPKSGLGKSLDIGQIFGLSLCLLPYFVYTPSVKDICRMCKKENFFRTKYVQSKGKALVFTEIAKLQ